MVAAVTPFYCTPLFGDTLEADLADLKRSARLAAAWIQTNGVDNGIAVTSYSGISGANTDLDKTSKNQRYFTALWKHLAHYRKKPILLCMDASSHMDKSDVLQAVTRAGWVDVAEGLGDTFRIRCHEKRRQDTIQWTEKGEEQVGHDRITCNNEV